MFISIHIIGLETGRIFKKIMNIVKKKVIFLLMRCNIRFMLFLRFLRFFFNFNMNINQVGKIYERGRRETSLFKILNGRFRMLFLIFQKPSVCDFGKIFPGPFPFCIVHLRNGILRIVDCLKT